MGYMLNLQAKYDNKSHRLISNTTEFIKDQTKNLTFINETLSRLKRAAFTCDLGRKTAVPQCQQCPARVAQW